LKLDVEFKKLSCPIFSLENDPITVEVLREHLKKEDIFFGVPDVITSFTASPENLKKDRFSLHTENGVLYLEDSKYVTSKLKNLTRNIKWVDADKMKSEWDAKLFIHNTPHCIAAFLGFIKGCEYVHEALQDKKIKLILEGVVDEVLQMLKLTTSHDHKFMEWYAKKEISRFSNTLLYDPVLRVAREPIRKLLPGGRLLGAIRTSIASGIVPKNLIVGAVAAMQYYEERDNDYDVISNIPIMGVEVFLSYYLNVDPNSSEGKMLINAYNELGESWL
jgi:mannitol-1-phosphate 5-dehydrogenase